MAIFVESFIPIFENFEWNVNINGLNQCAKITNKRKLQFQNN